MSEISDEPPAWTDDPLDGPTQVAHRAALGIDNANNSGGQGFTLSADQVHAALKEVNGYLDRLGDMQTSALQLQRLKPPAQDIASVDYNTALTEGGPGFASPFSSGGGAFDAAVTQIGHEIWYLQTLQAKLKKAVGITTGNDAESKTVIDQIGKSADAQTSGGMAG